MAARGECTSSLISIKEFKLQFQELDLQEMAGEMNVSMEIVTDLTEVCR